MLLPKVSLEIEEITILIVELASTVITQSSSPIDYFSLKADWDEMGVGVENVFVTVSILKLAQEFYLHLAS
jgi:hypothetical protein